MSSKQKWVLCERSGRWAPGLRIQIAARNHQAAVPHLHEVQGLRDVVERVASESNSLGLIEVRQSNLGEVLELLSRSKFGATSRYVALLDYSLGRGDWTPRSQKSASTMIADVLLEAGA